MTPKPEKSTAQAENEGLAARLLELRQLVEKQDQDHKKATAEVKQEVARMNATVDHLAKKVDAALTEIERRSRDLTAMLREGGEQVVQAGALARKMQDRVKVLDELREVAEDPRELLKPIRKDIAQLNADLLTLQKNTEAKLASITPKQNAQPWESR